MSDMSHLYRAYAAVHSTEVNQELTESRDEISQMDLTQLTESDLVLVSEEIISTFFKEDCEAASVHELVAQTLEEAATGSDSPLRRTKIERIAEAFDKAFGKVYEKAVDVCEEEFLKYMANKPLVEKWQGRVSHEHGNNKIHEACVAKDRQGVLEGLCNMLEAKITLSPGGKMGKDDKSSVEAHGTVDKTGTGASRPREDAKNKRMSASAKDPLDKQNAMNRAGRPGLDRLSTAVKSVQQGTKTKAEKEAEARAKRLAKRAEKGGYKGSGSKSINVGVREENIGVPSKIRQEWAEAYTSIYEKKLAAPDHDPVGQEDKDIDNDGDHDKTDKYLLNRRKVIGKAIAKDKGVKKEAYDAQNDDPADKPAKDTSGGGMYWKGGGDKYKDQTQKLITKKAKKLGLKKYEGPDKSKSNPQVTKLPSMAAEGTLFKKEELERIQAIVDSWDAE